MIEQTLWRKQCKVLLGSLSQEVQGLQEHWQEHVFDKMSHGTLYPQRMTPLDRRRCNPRILWNWRGNSSMSADVLSGNCYADVSVINLEY